MRAHRHDRFSNALFLIPGQIELQLDDHRLFGAGAAIWRLRRPRCRMLLLPNRIAMAMFYDGTRELNGRCKRKCFSYGAGGLWPAGNLPVSRWRINPTKLAALRALLAANWAGSTVNWLAANMPRCCWRGRYLPCCCVMREAGRSRRNRDARR